MKPAIIFLVGPTAVGKSETAVRLAKKINAEIISCDSMQIYKGMRIISSQPGEDLTKKAMHHLIGWRPPDKEYNVSLYRKDALEKIKEIIARKKIPLFTGGTGLYMSVLIDGIFKLKSENECIRKQLYEEAGKSGSQYIHNKLKVVDPEAAKKIHPNDTKRIVRALEVFETTGRRISELQKQRTGLQDEYEIKIFCLNIERDRLYKRITKRVEEMFAKGLMKEVSKLLKLKLSKTASMALGLRELKGYFEGLYDLDEAKKKIIRNTQMYSKRQLTWFRKDKRINWIEIAGGVNTDDIADKIYQTLCHQGFICRSA